MKIFNKTLMLLFVSLFILQSCNDDDNDTPIPEAVIPEIITINSAGLYPGKFDFNPRNNHFVLGSLVKSEVGLVNPLTGEYTTFINDPNFALVSGVRVDDANNRLIIASGDFGFSNQSVGAGQVGYLGIYNLETGEKIAGVNLRDLTSSLPSMFPNDIAVDNNGNIYITDSLNPFIYKVDGSTFEATIWLDGGVDFDNVSGGAGLLAMNGLEFKDNFLIAAKTDSGELFKIPIDNPQGWYRIGGPLYPGMDGLKLDGNGNLLMAETGLGPVEGARIVRTEDNWDSTIPVLLYEVEPDQFPTSVAIAQDGNAYVITSHLLELTVHGNFNDDSFDIFRIPSL